MAHRLRRSLLSASSLAKALLVPRHHQQPPLLSLSLQSRAYVVSEMRKSAFEANILRLLRNEIQYELDCSNPNSQSVSSFDSFSVDERPGEQWIKLTRKFSDKEEIKLEATMFDASVPVPIPGGVTTEADIKLHMTLIVDIFKGESDVLEFVCSAWPNSIQIQKVFVRGCDQIASQAYMGPSFKELDDDLQVSLYDYLEARGINDDLATFLHAYMKNKDKTEHIRWMGTVKSFIEKK